MVRIGFSHIAKAGAVIMCISTPSSKYRELDPSYIITTIDRIPSYLHKEEIISLRSTTYPGTTDKKNSYTTETIRIIIADYSKKCSEIITALYRQLVNKAVTVNSVKVSEIIKFLETSWISQAVEILIKDLICFYKKIQHYMGRLGKNLNKK